VRVLLLGFLIGCLQIPILVIEGLTSEREYTRDSAIADVTQSWGGTQRLAGPFLAVPYRYAWLDAEKVPRSETRWAYFLPDQLQISGDVETQERYRGIYKVTLYDARLKVRGYFPRPDLSEWEIRAEDVLWKGAALVLGVSDPKAIREHVAVALGAEASAFGPGRDAAPFLAAGISAPVGVAAAAAARAPAAPSAAAEQGKDAVPAGALPFAFELALNGSSQILFQPSGIETAVELASDWPDPSFIGAWLPTTREIHAEGFRSSWSIPNLGRNYPQKWLGQQQQDLGGSEFGVSLVSPVDAYRMTHRAVKYELMFVGLSFLAFFLFEVFTRMRIHPVQYLLVGAALCVFYLLTLSLAEHLGFATAYVIGAAAIALLVTSYSARALRSVKRGAVIGALLAGLYAFLYVLLALEDYALLIGSIGMFVILAVVMYVTRAIDWYDVKMQR
jgi:inner membrane protein